MAPCTRRATTRRFVTRSANSALRISSPHENVADLGIELVASEGFAGELVAHRVAVTDVGPDPALFAEVQVILQPGQGASLASASGEGWSCSVDGDRVACARDRIDVGEPSTITISALAGPDEGRIVARGTVFALSTDPQLLDNDTESSTRVAASADLGVAITATPEPVDARGALSYTLDVTSLGPSTASTVAIVATPSTADLIFTNAAGAGWTCSRSIDVRCARSELAPGASAPIEITGVAPSDRGPIAVTANVSAETADRDPTNNVATVSSAVTGVADLAITSSESRDPVEAGGWLAFSLDVENLGPGAAEDVVVTDTLPAGATLNVWFGDGWSCAANGQVVTCSRLALAVGSAPPLGIGIIAPGSATTLVNVATVASGGAGARAELPGGDQAGRLPHGCGRSENCRAWSDRKVAPQAGSQYLATAVAMASGLRTPGVRHPDVVT